MIRAAGGVLFRVTGDAVQVALVHRPGYGDWSLPKGKRRRGEHLLITACREVGEETGIRAVAGPRLAVEHYDTAAGPKAVEYWAMHGPDGVFVSTGEVDRVAWLPVGDARQQLSYQGDADALDALDALEGSAVAASSAVLLVRNGHPVAGGRRAGSDGGLPLDAKGRQQAEALRRVMPAFGPARLLSAPSARCVDTVGPAAEDLGLGVGTEPALAEDRYAADPRRAVARISELAASGGTTAVCAPGVVIRHLLATLADERGLYLPEIRSRNGSIWALFFSGRGLAAADYYDSLTERHRRPASAAGQ